MYGYKLIMSFGDMGVNFQSGISCAILVIQIFLVGKIYFVMVKMCDFFFFLSIVLRI